MLKDMSVMHPAAKMLVDLSAAQDVEAGDGTTSVVVIAGSLLGAADRLLAKGGKENFTARVSDHHCRIAPYCHLRVFPASGLGRRGNFA
jgi:chaperonin GroEL (HSP60 family)